jgi:hypothetical protein
MAYLSGTRHDSKRGVEEVVETIFGVPLGLGTVAAVEQEVSAALAPAHAEAAEAVRQAPAKRRLDPVRYPDFDRGLTAIEHPRGVAALPQDVNEINGAQDLDTTTKKALIDARLGQGTFRANVLLLWDNCCSVTGSTIQPAIRASHIKPWRDSSNAERLDPENGLPLIASLDALFDAGLISFEASGKLIASPKLSTKERSIFGIGETSLRKKPTAKTADYLAHHRASHGLES